MKDSKLVELIGLAYATAEDRSLWERLLLSTARAVGGVGACVISHDLVASGTAVVHAAFDPAALTLYNDNYHQVDAWAFAARTNWPAGARAVAADQTILPRSAFLQTEFYPLVRRYGISRMMHASFERDLRGVTGLSIYRTEADAPFGEHEVRFVEPLLPHLRRSFRLHEIVARARLERDAALEGLDALAQGVLLVTVDARVVHANRFARTLLEQQDGVGLDRSCLSAASSDVTASLRELCSACSRTTRARGTSAGGVLALPRPSGRRNLLVVVSPVTEREPWGVKGDSVTAIVLVSDPERDNRLDHSLLRVCYGLTKTEAEVAARLVAGDSLEEIATARGYTKETVRWYAKQILNKTGCRNRAAFVRQVSMLASLTSRESAVSDAG